jgi:hypothetical protein
MRLGALLVAGLGVAAVIAVRAWPRSGSLARHDSTRPNPDTLSSQPAAPSSPFKIRPPWPTARGACGADVPLPILSGTPVAERTGIHLLIGGDRLRVVNFDSGRASPLPGAQLRRGEYVFGIGATSATYAVTGAGSGCHGRGALRVLRIEPDGHTTMVVSLGRAEWLLTDGEHAWIARNPTGAHHADGSLTPLSGGPSVRLPPWVYPFDVASGLIVAQRQDGQAGPSSLVLVDLATGQIQTNLGARAAWAATGAGLLVWAQGCDVTADKGCVLHARTLATAATRTYRLPRPTFGGIVSPDGREVALFLQRANQDPRFASEHPIPPSDIALLHLDTGRLEIAPGIEVPAKTSPTMTFTPDGRWLVIAFNAGPKVRLLAWHPGLAHPSESRQSSPPRQAGQRHRSWRCPDQCRPIRIENHQMVACAACPGDTATA